MKLLHDMPEASTIWFVIYNPHYKEKLGTTKIVYNSCFCYKSDKLRITAFVYQPKTSFDSSQTI